MSEQTVEQYKAALAAEWNKFTATEVIYIDGVRAFNVGDAVPVGHIESGAVDKSQVAGTNTKAATAAKES